MPNQSLEFHLFPKLPESIRLRVWRHVVSVSRTVEIHEVHGTKFRMKEVGRFTRTQSTTRPPAVLSVCVEARNLALKEAYRLAYPNTMKGLVAGKEEALIYVNPRVDITYRDKQACHDGAAFRATDWQGNGYALDETETLAVDVMCVTRGLQVDYKPPEAAGALPMAREGQASTTTGKPLPAIQLAAKQILASRKGPRKVILVVGNDDDVPEFNLVPIESDQEQESGRYKQARLAAQQLQTEVNKLWRDKSSKSKSHSSAPEIEVMTVEREKLGSFSMFAKFPKEIQDHIWKNALEVPRILEMAEYTDDNGFAAGNILQNRRIPASLHVCHASRKLALRILSILGPKTGTNFSYFNNDVDSVLIPGRVTNLSFAQGLNSIAIQDGGSFSGEKAREVRSVGCNEMLIIGGRAIKYGWISFASTDIVDKYPHKMPEPGGVWYFIPRRKRGHEGIEANVTPGMPSIRCAMRETINHTLSPYSGERPKTYRRYEKEVKKRTEPAAEAVNRRAAPPTNPDPQAIPARHFIYLGGDASQDEYTPVVPLPLRDGSEPDSAEVDVPYRY